MIEYDSDFEVEIVEQDPDITEIELFCKLPKLKIKTPLGEYNPDFCYAIKPVRQAASDNDDKGTTLILVVESKGYETYTAIPPEEKGKYEFASKYFDYLNDYYKSNNENVRIKFTERINKVQLASILSKSGFSGFKDIQDFNEE